MSRKDGLKNYKELDVNDAKNDHRLAEVYRDWAKKYDYDNDNIGDDGQYFCVVRC